LGIFNEAACRGPTTKPEKKTVIVLNRHKVIFTGDIIVSRLCDTKTAVKCEDVKIKWC